MSRQNNIYGLHATCMFAHADKVTFTSIRMQHKCSTYITHTDYTVNKCTRLKQSIPRDRYVAMYACNIHMSTIYTCTYSLQIKRKSCKHTNCNTYVFVVQSRLQSRTFFPTKLISTAKFNMPDVILHGTYM